MNKELDKSTGKKSKCFKTGSEIVSSINNFVIRLRHFNCGITFVMQNIGDFDTREEDDFSAFVLNNAYSVAIFTNEDIPDKFAKSFGLIDDEVEHIGSSVRRQQRPDEERFRSVFWSRRISVSDWMSKDCHWSQS